MVMNINIIKVGMNENIDLTKILAGCPKGTEFYSPLFGKVAFSNIDLNITYPIRTNLANFTSDGRYLRNFNCECMLFPDKDQRIWSKFERFWDKPKVERFDPKTFQPFDKVLCRDNECHSWRCEFFSHLSDTDYPFVTIEITYKYCIPYNEDTKHLVGTTDEAPEYYRYWEEERC